MTDHLKAGIYPDIPSDRYHADQLVKQPSLSRSIAHKILTRSPRHAWFAHPRLNPDHQEKGSGTLDNGTAAHSLLFEGRKPVIVEADSWRTNDAKEQRADARKAGKVALLRKDAEQVMGMCDAVARQLDDHDCKPRPFTDGKAEQTLIWQEQGVWLRARADWLRDDFTALDDLKTTGMSASPFEWTRRRLWEDGLDIQAAMYRRGVKKLAGVDPEWRFVVVENVPPYALSIISLDAEALTLADAKLDKAIQVWKHCLQRNDWPGYLSQVAYAELPPWESSRWLERQALEEMAAEMVA